MEKYLRIAVSAILLLISSSALQVGFLLVKDPTGKTIGMQPELLHSYSPFTDFTIPGIILFSYLGVLSVIVAAVVWVKRPFINLLAASQGAGIFIWIVTQAIMIRTFHPLQIIIGTAGLLVFGLSLWLYKKSINS
jgi:hypothetical protein